MKLFNKISTQDKVDLIRNLSLLVKSGAPIDQSFDVLAEQNNPVLKKVLIEGRQKIEKGIALSDVFSGNPNFDKVFISFIKAGEESGTLSKNLDYLADWLEGKNTLEKEISSATLYPKIIVVFAAVLGSGLTIFVLPKMLPIFSTLDVSLPLTTRMLLFVSDLIVDNSVFLVLGLIVLTLLIYLLLRIRAVKTFLFKTLLRTPVVGPLMKDYQLAIIAQLIAVLLKSGTPINKILEIVSNSVSNFEYRDALDEVVVRVRKGTSLYDSVRKHPKLFPGIFASVVSVGEETGSLSESFEYLAKFFTARVKEKTAKLPTVIEPALLIAIGVFVAFIASAIIMPIYEVTKGLY
jgi:type II secretory pathway component PulF